MGVRISDGGLVWTATIDDSELNRIASRMEGRFVSLSQKVKDEGASMESFAKKAASAATAYLSLQGAGALISNLVKIRSEFQQLDIAFTTMLKSKAKADALMKELVTFASTTPFGLKDAAGAAKQLLAYGSTANTVVSELRMLGDVASGVSVPIGDLVYLYGTLKTQGRAYAMDIRQFAGRGIPIYAELAKVMGKNKDEIAGMVEAGKVGFPEVEKAFKNMTAAGGMFGGLMEAQSKTWAGQIERFKDAWDVMLNDIAKSQEGIFDTGIGAATSLVENYQKVLDLFAILIGVYGVYRAAMAATLAFEQVSQASRYGLALSLNQESVARIANANAMATELQATVSSLAVKKAAATQSALNAASVLREAEASLANASSNALIAAQDKATIARKAALAASSAFYTAKQNLETAAKSGANVATLESLRAEVSTLAAKQASTLQTSLNTAANAKNIEAKVLQSATEKVTAAQENVAITRKAALSASSEFYTAKTELETVAKVANSAATVELTATEALNAAGKRVLATAQAAYNAVLAASPVLAFTAIVTALGIAIYSLTQVTNAAERAQQALNDAHEEGGAKGDAEARKVEKLVEILKDHKATVEQQKIAYDALQDSVGSILKGYTQEQVAAGKATATLEEYIVKIREAASARKAFAEYNELADKMDELERKKISGVNNWSRVGRSLKNTFAPFTQGISLGDWANELIDGEAATKRIVDQEKEVLSKSMDALKKEFGGKFNEIITGSADDAPKTKKSRTVDVIDAEIKKLQESQNAMSETSKQYAVYTAQIRKLEAEKTAITGKNSKDDNEEFNALKRKGDMLNKIYELNEKYNDKSLTDDEQKLARIRSDYKALQHDIDVYNNNPKNKKVNKDLKPQFEKAIEDQTYRNDTEKLKTELEKQKTLYQDYENYKITLGKYAADQRYADEIDTSTTFLDKLKAQRKELEKDPLSMSGPEIEKFQHLSKLINEVTKDQKDKADQQYIDAYQAAETFGQKEISIRKKYSDQLDALLKKQNGVVSADQRKNLDEATKNAINAAKDEALAKTAIYKKLAEETFLLTKTQTKEQIKALEGVLTQGGLPPDVKNKIENELGKLKATLSIGIDQGNLDKLKAEYQDVLTELNSVDQDGNSIISEENKKQIIKRLGEIQAAINGIDLDGDGVASWGDKVADHFAYFKGTTSDVAAGVSKDLGDISGSFNELSTALGGSDTQAGYLLGTIGELAKIGGDAAGAVAGFASGDIIGGITKTISAVSGLFSLGKKVKEMNEKARKEVEDYYSNAIKGEREYQDQLKQRAIELAKNNKIALEGIRDQLALRKEQKAEYEKEASEIMAQLQSQNFISSETYKHGTLFRKAKTIKTYGSLQGKSYEELSQLLAQGKLEGDAKVLVERLKEIEQKGYDAEQAMAELAQQTAELFTGTTADNLTNSLAEMFRSGKTGAQDLADFFKQTMDDAALNIFKNKVLVQAMDSFYDEFSKAAESGDELTADEIARLNGIFTSLTGDALKKFEEFKKITGSDLSGSDSSKGTLKGQLQADLTEKTGTQFLGVSIASLEEFKKIGISGLESLKIANEHLQVAIKIEVNTRETADNTSALNDIAVDIKKIAENTTKGTIVQKDKFDFGL